MKRAALSLMLSFAVAGSLYAAQDPAPRPEPGGSGSAGARSTPAQASQDKRGHHAHGVLDPGLGTERVGARECEDEHGRGH